MGTQPCSQVNKGPVNSSLYSFLIGIPLCIWVGLSSPPFLEPLRVQSPVAWVMVPKSDNALSGVRQPFSDRDFPPGEVAELDWPRA